MGNWTGEADATQEGAGGGGGNFTPAPRGIYTIQVADVKAGKTKESNRDKVDLECEISDEGDQFGKKVWLTVTFIKKGEKGHGLMLHSFSAFGIKLDGNFDFDPEQDLQGRSARVLLGVTTREKVKDGKTYVNEVNFIEALYTEKHPEPKDGVLPEEKQPRGAASKMGATALAGGSPGGVPPNIAKTFPGARPAKQQEVPF